MPKNRAVDDYIARAQPFAKPILKHVRALVHEAAPELREELKWGMPCFVGNGIVCGVGGFKAHCTLFFWKAAQMKDAAKLANAGSKSAMGNFGRIASLADLPSDATLRRYVKEAVALDAVKTSGAAQKPRATREPVVAPDDLLRMLSRNADARLTFDALTESQKRDYVRWITEAKREQTRAKRLATTIEWLADGKTFMWRYEKMPSPLRPERKRATR